MVELTKEKEETTIREGEKTRGKVDAINRIVWFYMIKKHGLSEQQLAHMSGAVCPAKVKDNPATLVRIFDPDVAKEKGIDVQDYESLNEHPGLILYEGYYYGHGRAREIIVERRNEVGPSLLENKIKEGAITEVGVTKEKTATHKWLGRIGNFMMMGGFILVLILGVGIVIAISILTKGC